MYPFGELGREDSAFLIDVVVQIVDLGKDPEEDVNFGDNFFRFSLSILRLRLAIYFHISGGKLPRCYMLSIKRCQ